MIVTTEIDADIPGSPRTVFYRCTDSEGVAHPYGPVFTSDPAFDADAHKAVVASKVAEALAAQEFEQVIA